MFYVFTSSSKIIFQDLNISEKVCDYKLKELTISNFVSFCQSTQKREIVIEVKSMKEVLDFFFNNFVLVTASGGIVYNINQEILFIKRRGMWDLPKGKIDFGESIQSAALREVEEETGVSCKITLKYALTKHIYILHDILHLKITHWFKMNAESNKLAPQKEEEITEVRWIDICKEKQIKEKMFFSLRDLMVKL